MQRLVATLAAEQVGVVSVQPDIEVALVVSDSDKHGGCDCFSDEFAVLAATVQSRLAHLEQAAALAYKIDENQSGDDPGTFIGQFLEDYYWLLDPAGIAKRMEERTAVWKRSTTT